MVTNSGYYMKETTFLNKIKKELENRLRAEKKKFWYNLSPTVTTVNSFLDIKVALSPDASQYSDDTIDIRYYFANDSMIHRDCHTIILHRPGRNINLNLEYYMIGTEQDNVFEIIDWIFWLAFGDGDELGQRLVKLRIRLEQDVWKELRDEEDPEYTHRIETIMLHTFGQYKLGTLINRRIPIMTEGTTKMWTFVPFLVGPEQYIIGKLEKKALEDPMKLEWRSHKGDSSTDWCIGNDWIETTAEDLISLAVKETEESLFNIQHLHFKIDALLNSVNTVPEKT